MAGPFPITFLGAAVFKVKRCVRFRITRYPRQNGVITRSSLSFDHFVFFPCSVDARTFRRTTPSPPSPVNVPQNDYELFFLFVLFIIFFSHRNTAILQNNYGSWLAISVR